MGNENNNHCDYAGLSNPFMNLLIIGDPHAHPDYDNKRFTATITRGLLLLVST